VDAARQAREKRQFVLHVVEERRVKFIQLWFTDVLGIPKSLQITPAELEGALQEGVVFDGSAIDGFSRVQESDVIARPDPDSFTIVPRQPQVARMFCNIVDLDGRPFDGCPRNVLTRVLTEAHELGLRFFIAPEVEYFYLDPSNRQPTALDEGSYFDLKLGDLGTGLRRDTVAALEEAGIAVMNSQHEDAPSQHEIDLRATDALSMADNLITTRLVVEQIAEERGVLATFMPKPFEDAQGSGLHLYLSLFDEGGNVFAEGSDDTSLGPKAAHFVAGLLAHAPAITAITNQWVNSYKRLVPGYEAPAHVAWARYNRSALVRVPISRSTREDRYQIEYRAPDPACNPYLSFSLLLAAGLDGMTNQLPLPPETTENLFRLSDEEIARLGIARLPGSLEEALHRMESSTLVRKVLGDHVTEWFIRNKHDEWARYNRHVSEFEIARYLRIL